MALPNVDLLVVGGGILGAMHAYHALQRGLTVRLLEKDLHPQGATARNFGQVVPSGMAPDRWQGFGRDSLDTYKQIHAQAGLPLREEGSLYIASDEEEAALLDEAADHFARQDYPCERLTATACQTRLAGLRAEYVHSGLLFPEEVTVEPAALIREILAYLVEQHNLDYRSSTPILGLDAVSNGIVGVDAFGQTHRAAQAIVCTGSDFKLLFPERFAASDIEVTKLHMLETAPQPSSYRMPGNVLTGLTIRRYESFAALPSYAALNKDHLNPRLLDLGIHILFKQTPDGRIVTGDSHEYQPASHLDALGFDVDYAINRLILDEAQRILDLPDWTIGRAWWGIYSQSKSRDIYQESLDDRIHIVTAIGGKGMTGSGGFARQHIASCFNLTPASL
ncbi:MAG: TIGR03364 family FAD-dependent oxidoreductase [Rhodothermales bacterium]